MPLSRLDSWHTPYGTLLANKHFNALIRALGLAVVYGLGVLYHGHAVSWLAEQSLPHPTNSPLFVSALCVPMLISDVDCGAVCVPMVP